MLDDPSSVPPHVRISHTDWTVTIKDAYPKAHYHRLVLPRLYLPLEPDQLRDIRSLLCLPREQAKGLLLAIRRDAEVAKREIEEEMLKDHGFTWPIYMGFHALPSLEYVPPVLKHLRHVHLHVISGDFQGYYYKKKKHANSFHPRMGFFLNIDEVIRWFDPDIEPTYFAMKTAIDEDEYAAILKRDPLCPHCDGQFKTVVKLKRHLTNVFKEMKAAARVRSDAAAAAGSVNAPAGDDASAAAPSAAVDGAAAGGTAAPRGTGPSESRPTSAAPTGANPANAPVIANPAVDPLLAFQNDAATAGSGTAAGTAQKRKHAESAREPSQVIDVDALPDPSPAKRPQLGTTSSS
ncbi:hypothetical protein BN946_scf184785.g22 [Trametes cinnabarina]|uniref:Aprataxin C2HE/C2H2/C2HC zinc finger domain-containing protein n=1 Tax=Pycnoporus cinnabarinus TaxID=5643 RepID=A0A060S4Z3_PYCCI|nr:hypothetical protein BN946_scf184785.g22 [Trametes cinnabarina]